MIGTLKRAADGPPLGGHAALEERIAQLHEQSRQLAEKARLLEILSSELPDLSDEASRALLLLVTER